MLDFGASSTPWRAILEMLPAQRQTMLFSAKTHAEVMRDFCRLPDRSGPRPSGPPRQGRRTRSTHSIHYIDKARKLAA